MCSVLAIRIIIITRVIFKVTSFRRKIMFCRKRISSSTQLNEKFYQTILRAYENDNSIIITKVEQSLACEKGTNYVTVVYRVNVCGSKGSETYRRSLIIKTLPPEEQLNLYRCHIAAENESNSYNKIVPALNRHSVEGLPIPQCIYADKNVTVLEDLAAKRFIPLQRTNGGLALEQCEIVLKGLAQIHAASFVLERKEPEKFAELCTLTKELLYTGGDSPLLDYQTHYIDHAITLFRNSPGSDENQKCLDVLEDMRLNARARIKKLLLIPRRLSVICHGDPWVGNIMFNSSNGLRLVDLQLMRHQSVASDLSYLLYINLKPEVHFENREKLLVQYLGHLQRNIKANGFDLDDVLTEEWLKTEMSTFAEYGVVCGMWVMPAFFVKKEDVDMSKERLSNASLIAKKAGQSCDERLKQLILGYVKNVKC